MVRSITRDAATNNYRLSSFVMGVVNSPAFRSKRAETVAADAEKENKHDSTQR
jgi:hypothetical protein